MTILVPNEYLQLGQITSNTPSCSIRISQSSQITLLQLGHNPDAYLSSPHISHCILELEIVLYPLLPSY
jgi:hypothetical protein